MSSTKVPFSNSTSTSRSELSKDLQTTDNNEEESAFVKEMSAVIDSLRKQLSVKRRQYVERTMEENKQKLSKVTLSKDRRNSMVSNTIGAVDLLVKGQNDAIKMLNDIEANDVDKSSSGSDDGSSSSVVLMGSNIPVRNSVRPHKLPEVQRLPPYTTWIFLDRNQRMADDQSVVGRRRIYYDQSGGEALICSDSEEELIEDDGDKKPYAEAEDYILRMSIEQVGISDAVLDVLGKYLCRKPSDLKARYEILSRGEVTGTKVEDTRENLQNDNPYIEKDLEGALDSFDNLFCRRCYVFDCKLHGCSQDLVFPVEKQHPWSSHDNRNSPCGPYCYQLAKQLEIKTDGCSSSHARAENIGLASDGALVQTRKKLGVSSNRRKLNSCQSESLSANVRNISESSESETQPTVDKNMIEQPSSPTKTKLAGKSASQKKKKRTADRVGVSTQKKQKKIVISDSESPSAEISNSPPDTPLNDQTADNPEESLKREEFVDESSVKQEIRDSKSWKNLEESLFEKGLEIFGRNSCLISRNLLNGLKSCVEVHQFMTDSDNKNSGDAAGRIDGSDAMGNEGRRRSRLVRRRGRVRRLKYTWKSAAYHSIRKRISEKKDQPCRQYNPCGCQSACGKQCACLLSGTCCEKYCGCPKNCKNRFRGCHCAKSQCRSRQCPCFAADRECDPDVCRNCWVSCGDGTLGIPNQRGDNYECRNMKLLLKQQQRVLLGRSDISGWGAFLKNTVPKHEYLGEYTGELISHREADKRGKIYDRENSSFLFNLNDQFVLDAYRKGDKLKFANHAPDPNCYAKVIMVAGDHRVGIFAKERINGGEELFYDYRYEPDRAPAWARKPEAGAKKDEAGPSTGRARKLA